MGRARSISTRVKAKRSTVPSLRATPRLAPGRPARPRQSGSRGFDRRRGPARCWRRSSLVLGDRDPLYPRRGSARPELVGPQVLDHVVLVLHRAAVEEVSLVAPMARRAEAHQVGIVDIVARRRKLEMLSSTSGGRPRDMAALRIEPNRDRHVSTVALVERLHRQQGPMGPSGVGLHLADSPAHCRAALVGADGGVFDRDHHRLSAIHPPS